MHSAEIGELRPVSAEDVSDTTFWTVLSILFIAGVLFRLNWFGDFAFPINDGALFVVIAEAIIANDMILPPEYDFNGYTLPLGYPPLALWFVAAISKLAGIDLVLVATWYPLATNFVLIAGFVGLLRAINLPRLPNKSQQPARNWRYSQRDSVHKSPVSRPDPGSRQ